jgi:ATP-binding cassette subfamily B protein
MAFGPRGGGRSAAYGAGDDPATRVPKERRGATIRRIAAFFRPYRWQVLVVLGAILLTSLLGLVNPLLLKALIDSAIPSGSWQELNLFVALMIIVPIISGLIGVGQSYWNNVVGQHVMQDLRNALYAHLQKMPLRFFAETRTGEIQSRLANDVGGVQSVVTDTASSVVSNVVIAVTTIIAMLFISWQLTVLSLVVLPFFMWLTYRVGKIRRSISTETQETMADVSAITQETLSVSGILLSKTFGQQTASVERFRLANAKLAALQIRQSMVGRWFFMIVGTIFSIMPAFVYWLAGALIFTGVSNAPTIGDIGLHDPPEPLVLPARPAAQRARRGPGRAGALRPHLRLSRSGARDQGCGRCPGAGPIQRPRRRTLPGRRLPISDDGTGRGQSRDRERRGRHRRGCGCRGG